MNNANVHREMLINVAVALGTKLCQKMVFVGGCTTSLLLTDAFTKEQVRHTDDVDLIIHVLGISPYYELQEELSSRNFKENPDVDDPICAMKLGELRVDFMPDDESILGFSNRWYRQAFNTAEDYQLTTEITIKLVTPVFFIVTKLEAYLGRGKSDPLESRDIEDFLNLFSGRKELVGEIKQSSEELQFYISNQIEVLLVNRDFEYAIQSTALNDKDREDLVFSRLESVVGFKR